MPWMRHKIVDMICTRDLEQIPLAILASCPRGTRLGPRFNHGHRRPEPSLIITSTAIGCSFAPKGKLKLQPSTSTQGGSLASSLASELPACSDGRTDPCDMHTSS